MRWQVTLEFGIGIYTLLYLKQITKDLLYSTGNSVQYSVINKKRIWKWIDTYIWIIASLCYTPEANTTLQYKITTPQYKIKVFEKKE